MTGYIMDLRALVGHRPLLLVGASVIVQDKAGRILLEKRADNHLWGYAGGSIELDERAEDAAVRELYEETGLTAKSLTLFNVFSGPDMHYVYPNGDEVSCIDLLFTCRDYEGTLTAQPDEVEELRFFAPEELPKPEEFSPPIRRAFYEWLEKNR